MIALSYPSEAETLASFSRFTVFHRTNPRQQITVLALDAEHAEVEGSAHLDLPRRLVSVIRAPGYLDSRGLC